MVSPNEAAESRATAAAVQRGLTGRPGHQVHFNAAVGFVTRRTTGDLKGRQIELDTTKFADLVGWVVCSGALSPTKNINVSGGRGREEGRKKRKKRKQGSAVNEKLGCFFYRPCEPTGRFLR